jgi:hypothetical protein
VAMVVHPKLSSLSKLACILFVTIDFCLTITVAAGGDVVYTVIPQETPYLRGCGRYIDGELYERHQPSNIISLAGDTLVLVEGESVAAVSVVAASTAVAVYTVIPSGAPYPCGGRNNDGELYEFQSNLTMVLAGGDVLVLEDELSVAVNVAAGDAVAVHTVIPSGAPYPCGGRDNDGELFELQSNLTVLTGDALVLEDESVVAVSIAAGDDLYTVIPRKTPYLRGGRYINGELYERQRQPSNRMSLAGDALVLEDEYVAVSVTAGDAVGDAALVLEDESVMVSVTAGDVVGDALVVEDESVVVSVAAGDAVATVIPQETPHPRGGGSIDGALFQCIRWVASAVAFLVWHAIVLYWAGFQQEPITTILVTVVGLAVRRHLAERWAIYQKEWYVIHYRTLVHEALYRTHGPIAADVLWGRVAARAFPSSRRKRDQLKAKVWKYIVINADDDFRIEITQVQGKAIWEWVDDKAPPAGLE